MAVVVGLVRAGLLLASVMLFDHGMAVVVDEQTSDPQRAAAMWQVIEPVAEALGGAGGLGVLEVVVGMLQIVWFLWFGISTARTGSAQVVAGRLVGGWR